MAILEKNIIIVGVSFINTDLTIKNNGDKLQGVTQEYYIIDRSLYGTDNQFVSSMLAFAKSKYSQQNNKILQVKLMVTGTLISTRIF